MEHITQYLLHSNMLNENKGNGADIDTAIDELLNQLP